jgi:hypothetical protein
MHAADQPAASRNSLSAARGKYGLTNLAADLLYKSNDHTDSQGNYDYHAHAQVYAGGADPLESQGYLSAVENPSSS